MEPAEEVHGTKNAGCCDPGRMSNELPEHPEGSGRDWKHERRDPQEGEALPKTLNLSALRLQRSYIIASRVRILIDRDYNPAGLQSSPTRKR